MAYSILIVDDSALIRNALKIAFEKTNLPIQNLYIAVNGHQALDVINNNWVDIIFTDLHMPKMTGFELIEKIKNNQLFSDIPAVILSSERSKVKLGKLKELGIEGVIQKPFKEFELKEIVIKLAGDWEYEHSRELSTDNSDNSSDF